MTDDDPVAQPPRHWEADVVVADGGTVHLRPIRPSDADALVAFHGGLSQRTRYLRYFSAYPRIPRRDLDRFVTVDHADRVAFVAELAGEIVAVGRYERTPGTDEAEIAFVVADRHQGRGIGSVLLEHLAAAARERGLRRFHAVVLAENTSMMRVFLLAGYETTRRVERGEVTLEFAVDETDTTAGVMREREQRAEARSIERLLHPASVAVVGASNDDGKIGHAVFANLLRSGFQGPLYPINADARHVGGVPAYPSVLDVPDDIDLVVIAVPAASVPGVVEQCAERGVRGLVVISGGFGESGSEAERATGRDAQNALVGAARAHGQRVVGPNCLGVINTDVGVSLNASLATVSPRHGRAGFFCQSGALGVAVLAEASRRGLGVSTFVSAGNRADVSGNDLMQYWETDEDTDVVLMYLESFGNPRKFARLARRLGRSKPVVAVKSGNGMVVPGLAQNSVDVPETSVRALFEAAGVIRVDTVGDLFDVALVLTSQPLPAGLRVAVVGNSAALGTLIINALDQEGLQLARLEDVGVGPDSVERFAAALRAALDDPFVDALVVVFVPPLLQASSQDAAVALRTIAASATKPIVSTFQGFTGVPPGLSAVGDVSPVRGSVPSYASPERAVRSLALVARYAMWLRRDPGTLPQFDDVDLDAARALVTGIVAGEPDGRELTRRETQDLLDAVGLEVRAGGEGVDTVLTLQEDESFGAVLSFGVAGVATELLGDRAYAPVPVTTTDASDLIGAPRAAPMLDGYGGLPVTDRAALAGVALRLSVLADAVPDLGGAVFDVRAQAVGATVASARVWVRPAATRPDSGPRRLRGL